MPSDDRTHELLPWYVTGMLDEDETADFSRHLEKCEACKGEKAFLDKVRVQVERHGEAFLEDHPTSERIVAYARGELPEPDAVAVRRHMELCATCPVEASWVTGEAVARSAPAAPARRAWLGWGAALAAVIALVSVLPFILDRGDSTAVLRPQLIGETQRSGARPNVVELRPEESKWTAYFPIDLPAESFPCTVEIADESGRPVFRMTGIERGDLVAGLYLFVECARRTCPQGKYEVRVEASGDQPPETLPFEVTTGSSGS